MHDVIFTGKYGLRVNESHPFIHADMTVKLLR